jgi:DNA (cytosine-5)-methyltransferase 1
MISVATDCSGIDAPIFAFKKLKIPIKHVFSCDIDANARVSIEANCKPANLFENIFRNHKKSLYADFYFLGFPCQTFSMAGKREGFSDTRGTVFFEGVKYIKNAKPKVFVLENVKGLINHENGETFKVILKSLKMIRLYHIYFKVLNSKDFGVCQNRERVFIVGIRKDVQSKGFEFPTPCRKKDTSLHSIIESNPKIRAMSDFEKRTLKKHQTCKKRKGIDIFKQNYIVDTGASFEFSSIMENICPCLKATRCDYYLTKYQRKLTPRECLRLQGFPDSFKIKISDNQVYKQAGNSITVNVLAELIKCIIKCTNLKRIKL